MKMQEAEIVIGICTKNCEKTIQNVIKKVDDGLSEFYPNRKSLIVVSDLSDDSTKEKVEKTETKNPVQFTRQDGGPGKGNGIKTVFRIAQESGADAVALVDGDLTSIETKWIKALIEPVDEGFDLAVPYYERHKYDSVITNHVIYPFVTSMYGTEVRQPIGGEFGLSSRLFRKLMKHPKFPEGFGIDIFITTSAIADGMKVSETALGVKSHASTESYNDFEKFLVPMFGQVVSTLFELTLYNRDECKNVSVIKGVRRFGDIKGGSVAEAVVDRKVIFNIFQRDYDKIMKSDVLSDDTKEEIRKVIEGSRGKGVPKTIWRNSIKDLANYVKSRIRSENTPMRPDILSEDTKKGIREFIYGESGQIISVETWVKAVFDAFRSYRDPSKRDEAIRVLMAVWMGRFSSFVRQTRFMDTRDAECLIRGQVNAFNEEKHRAFHKP
ncbi:MAG: glycosyltransferase [Candidatus Aenigmarchaeota archaeon]|nr:glycosyltransferase [Candidatus Aenigmarchaeota archaeon]